VRHAAAPLIDGTAATDDVACSHHFPLDYTQWHTLNDTLKF
jgi:hypothetical protein